MAMSSHKKLSVGIKELKDRASEIIATVQRTGREVSITKNNQEVARITPIPVNPHQRLVATVPGPARPKPPPSPGAKTRAPKTDLPASVRPLPDEPGYQST